MQIKFKQCFSSSGSQGTHKSGLHKHIQTQGTHVVSCEPQEPKPYSTLFWLHQNKLFATFNPAVPVTC